MARSRGIKPSLFKNEILGVADPLYTLLFEGLWCLADREGRLEDRPLRIRGEIFPYREGLDIAGMLDWLQAEKFIQRYEAEGKKCIMVLEFVKHQNPHKNEAPSELPAPMFTALEQHSEAVPNKSEQSPNKSEALGLTPDSCSLTPDSLFSDSLSSALQPLASAAVKVSKSQGYSDDFEEAWTAYPSRPGVSKTDAFKAWSARIKSGVDPGVMVAGVARYAAYCKALGTEPQFIKQPATFFGPGEHYQSEWAAPKTKPDTSRHSGFDSKNYREGIAEDGSF